MVQPMIDYDNSALGNLKNNKRTIVYIVSHSFPFTYNGYSVRTHGIARGLIANGYNVIVVNRPGRPWDLGPVSLDHQQCLDQVISDVRYIYLPYPVRKLMPDYPAWLTEASKVLHELLTIIQPEAVLAASNWETAEAALLAANQARLPFYYEVRGFWELSRVAKDPAWQQSAEFALSYRKEAEIASQAMQVFTLNSLMEAELVRRGVQKNNISLLPNGCVSLPAISVAEKSPATPFRVGYIGSFNDYEGLPLLIEACAQLKAENHAIELHFVGASDPNSLTAGAGSLEHKYLQLASTLNFDDAFTIFSRVTNDQVDVHYQNIDLIVNPRLSHLVTEIVSALKPIEAAAFGKLTLLSSLPPNQELAAQSEVFRLFNAGSVSSLKHEIKTCIEQPQLRRAAQLSGPAWVSEHRLFKHITEILLENIQTDNSPSH